MNIRQRLGKLLYNLSEVVAKDKGTIFYEGETLELGAQVRRVEDGKFTDLEDGVYEIGEGEESLSIVVKEGKYIGLSTDVEEVKTEDEPVVEEPVVEEVTPPTSKEILNRISEESTALLAVLTESLESITEEDKAEVVTSVQAILESMGGIYSLLNVTKEDEPVVEDEDLVKMSKQERDDLDSEIQSLKARIEELENMTPVKPINNTNLNRQTGEKQGVAKYRAYLAE